MKTKKSGGYQGYPSRIDYQFFDDRHQKYSMPSGYEEQNKATLKHVAKRQRQKPFKLPKEPVDTSYSEIIPRRLYYPGLTLLPYPKRCPHSRGPCWNARCVPDCQSWGDQ
jgi:hypothetical protein